MKKPFSMDQTWLECIGCGHKADLLEERTFACPECGNLYDVEHNYPKLTFGEFTDRFDRRARSSFVGLGKDLLEHGTTLSLPELQSGVWRFREWIMPYLPYEYIVTLGEGNVPIMRAGKNLSKWVGPVDLWIIHEGMTMSGAFKCLGMTVMVSIALAVLARLIFAASTGDTSASARGYAARAGLKCGVAIPHGRITPIQLAQLDGAKVIELPGSFDDCMKAVQELVNAGKIYPANSLNPTRIEGHQATVFLTAQFFGWQLPDWIAAAVGNGSNISSIGKGSRLMERLGFTGKMPRILGSQSRAACPLSKSWLKTFATEPYFKDNPRLNEERWLANYKPMNVGETTATAARIGKPVSRNKVIREIVASNGKMNIASEKMLNEAVAICNSDGISVCPQTGIALAGVKQAVENGWIEKGSTVVVVSTATGLKFIETSAARVERSIIRPKDCRTETVAKILGL
jgi:threonine synthase